MALGFIDISEHRPATLQRPPARRGLQCPVWRFHKQAAGRGSYVPAQDREAGRSFLFIRQPIANERPRTGGMKLRQIGKPLGLTPKTACGHRVAHRRFDPVTIFGGVV